MGILVLTITGCSAAVLNPQMESAAKSGDVEAVREWVKKGNYVDARNKKNETLLFVAAKKGNVDIVKLLIDHGANVDAQNKKGATALAYVAKIIDTSNDPNSKLDSYAHSYLKIARLLVKNGANIHAKDCTEECVHSGRNYPKLIKKIIEKDYDLIWETQFITAEGVNDYLSREKVNIDFKDETGRTALMIAAQNDYLDTVKVLVENGAALNTKDRHKTTPLMQAASNGNLNIVKYLVKNGAKINAKDDWRSPLLYAIENGHQKVAKYLIDQKADLGIWDRWGSTPIVNALRKKHFDLAKYMIDNGDSEFFNIKDIWYAIRVHNYEIADKLLNKGTSLSESFSGIDITQLLAMAAEEGNLNILINVINHAIHLPDNRQYNFALDYVDNTDKWKKKKVLSSISDGKDKYFKTLIKFKYFKLGNFTSIAHAKSELDILMERPGIKNLISRYGKFSYNIKTSENYDKKPSFNIYLQKEKILSVTLEHQCSHIKNYESQRSTYSTKYDALFNVDVYSCTVNNDMIYKLNTFIDQLSKTQYNFTNKRKLSSKTWKTKKEKLISKVLIKQSQPKSVTLSNITLESSAGGYDVYVEGNYQCRLLVNREDNLYVMQTSGCDNYVNGQYSPSLNELGGTCGYSQPAKSLDHAMKLLMKCSFDGSY